MSFIFIVGLDYVTWIVKEGDTKAPTFQCDVCNTLLNHGNLLSHVSGVKHRHNYIVSTTVKKKCGWSKLNRPKTQPKFTVEQEIALRMQILGVCY